jgi:hypothetical protein
MMGLEQKPDGETLRNAEFGARCIQNAQAGFLRPPETS